MNDEELNALKRETDDAWTALAATRATMLAYLHTLPPVETDDATDSIRRALVIAEAALADIGDADREPEDDLAWCERRAMEALPAVRAALAAPAGEPSSENEARQLYTGPELTARIEFLESKLAGDLVEPLTDDAKDAQRYRWLRAWDESRDYLTTGSPWVIHIKQKIGDMPCMVPIDGTSLDAAIDAAMEVGK